VKKKESFLADCPERRPKLSRDVTLSYQEVPDGKQRTERLAGILSEGVYTYLKHKGRSHKRSPFRGKEN
jgi:hypothetical protein